MNRSFPELKLLGRSVVLATLFASGCETSPPKPVEFTEQESVVATVKEVDVAAKRVTLTDSAGEDLTIRVPEARNLAQVEAGDTLRVSYFATYRASIAEPGKSESGAVATAGRAPEGDRPGAVIAVGGATTVEVISVSADGSSVSFRDEDGLLDTMRVVREEGQAFAKKLKRGDMVVLQYVEAVAVEVEEREHQP